MEVHLWDYGEVIDHYSDYMIIQKKLNKIYKLFQIF